MIAFPGLGSMGRLGNQLWQIAGTAGIAFAGGTDPAFPDDWQYRHVFKVPDELFHPRSDLEGVENVIDSPRLSHINPRDRCYMQDMGLWHDYALVIREWFSITQSALLTVYEKYTWLDELLRPVCGVHVRRGDYVTLPWHFPVPSMWYYLKGIDSLHPRSTVVFSDDPVWCKQQFPSSVHVFYGGAPMPTLRPANMEPTDWHDFVALMACDSFVLSNSTFGWWAAYLSGSSSVVYPTPWFGEALPEINPALMFTRLPKWVQRAY